jgi:hypothetical protein
MSLMPEFREQLTTAAAAGHGRGGLRRGASAAPVAAAVLVAVAIAALALLALRHGSSPGRSTGVASGAPPGAATARGQLQAELGVLRHGTGRTPRAVIPLVFRPIPHRPKGAHNLDYTRLDRRLARVVRLGHYQVGILPTTWRPPGRSYRSEGVVASFYGPGVDQQPARIQRRDPVPQSSSSILPAAPSEIARRGLIVDSETAPGIDRGAVVVPDGVAAVRLSALRILRTASTAPVAVAVTPVTDAVRDNVAPLRLTGLTLERLGLSATAVTHRLYMARPAVSGGCRFTFAVYGMPGQARIGWLDASGHVTRTVTTALTVYVTTWSPVTPRSDIRACEAAKHARR